MRQFTKLGIGIIFISLFISVNYANIVKADWRDLENVNYEYFIINKAQTSTINEQRKLKTNIEEKHDLTINMLNYNLINNRVTYNVSTQISSFESVQSSENIFTDARFISQNVYAPTVWFGTLAPNFDYSILEDNFVELLSNRGTLEYVNYLKLYQPPYFFVDIEPMFFVEPFWEQYGDRTIDWTENIKSSWEDVVFEYEPTFAMEIEENEFSLSVRFPAIALVYIGFSSGLPGIPIFSQGGTASYAYLFCDYSQEIHWIYDENDGRLLLLRNFVNFVFSGKGEISLENVIIDQNYKFKQKTNAGIYISLGTVLVLIVTIVIFRKKLTKVVTKIRKGMKL